MTPEFLTNPNDKVAYDAWEDHFFDLSGRKIGLVDIYLTNKPDGGAPKEVQDSAKDDIDKAAAIQAWELHQLLTAWRFLIARVKHTSYNQHLKIAFGPSRGFGGNKQAPLLKEAFEWMRAPFKALGAETKVENMYEEYQDILLKPMSECPSRQDITDLAAEMTQKQVALAGTHREINSQRFIADIKKKFTVCSARHFDRVKASWNVKEELPDPKSQVGVITYLSELAASIQSDNLSRDANAKAFKAMQHAAQGKQHPSEQRLGRPSGPCEKCGEGNLGTHKVCWRHRPDWPKVSEADWSRCPFDLKEKIWAGMTAAEQKKYGAAMGKSKGKPAVEQKVKLAKSSSGDIPSGTPTWEWSRIPEASDDEDDLPQQAHVAVAELPTSTPLSPAEPDERHPLACTDQRWVGLPNRILPQELPLQVGLPERILPQELALHGPLGEGRVRGCASPIASPDACGVPGPAPSRGLFGCRSAPWGLRKDPQAQPQGEVYSQGPTTSNEIQSKEFANYQAGHHPQGEGLLADAGADQERAVGAPPSKLPGGGDDGGSIPVRDPLTTKTMRMVSHPACQMVGSAIVGGVVAVCVTLAMTAPPPQQAMMMRGGNLALRAAGGSLVHHEANIDSGCLPKSILNHVDFFPDGFDDSIQSIPIEGFAGTASTANRSGDARFMLGPDRVGEWHEVVLPGAIYVRDAKISLISVQQLWDDAGIDARFRNINVLTLPCHAAVPFDARTYNVGVRKVPPGAQRANMSTSTPRLYSRGKKSIMVADHQKAELWRHRMCNVSTSRLRRLPDLAVGAPRALANLTDEPQLSRDIATAPRSKVTSYEDLDVSTLRGIARGTACFDLWRAPCASIHSQSRYLAGFVYLATPSGIPAFHIQVYPMRTKSTFPVVCERYLCDMRTIAEVKRFYSDNEAVLNSAAVDAVCRTHSIRHDNSCPYEPWQNPAELIFKFIIATARHLHLLRGADSEFWEFTIPAVVWVHNHLPPSDPKRVSPLHACRGKPPSLTYAKVWGCAAWEAIPEPLRTDKLAPQRNTTSICVGPDDHRPGWLLWDTASRKLTHSSRVYFDEGRFPLLELKEVQRPPLPTPAEDDSRDRTWFAPTALDTWDTQPRTGSGDAAATNPPTGGEGDGSDQGADPTPHVSAGVRRSSRLRTSRQPPLAYQPRLGGRESAADLTCNLPTPPPNPYAGDPARGVDTLDTTTEVESSVGGSDTEVVLDTTTSSDPMQLAMSVASQVRGSVEEELETQVEELRTAADAINGEGIAAPGDAPQTQRELDALPLAEQEEWYAADDAEFEKLVANNTFGDAADIGTVRHLPIHTVRKVKRTGEKKSRDVVGGHLQVEGIHYDLHSSPAASWTGVRTFLSLVALRALSAILIDFESAYTQSILPEHERVWVRLPKRYRTFRVDSSGKMVEQLRLLLRSLYGLKQAGLLWNKLLNDFLVSFGFKRCFADYCVYTLTRGNATILICLYVDDMMIGHNDPALLASFLEGLRASGLKFNMLPDLSDLLGAQVVLAPGRAFLHLEKYLQGIGDRFRADLNIVEEAEGQGTSPYACAHLAPCSVDLRDMVDMATAVGTSPSTNTSLVRKMQAILGCIGYAVQVCRADAAYAHGLLSRVATRATDAFYFAALCLLRYLVNTARRGILYSGDLTSVDGIFPPTELVSPYTLTDASWGLRRSISGVLIFLGGGMIRFASKTQASIALSTVEAEYMAMSIGCCHLLFVLHLLQDLGLDVPLPLLIKTDSEGARKLSRNMSNTGLAMHIERRYLRIREIQSEGKVRVEHLKGLRNLSDIMTKYDPITFEKYRDVLLPLLEDSGIDA